ncbi:MAG: polysaccharide biosynthesis C-terminal domain-containing protein [Bacteroidota bacterium]
MQRKFLSNLGLILILNLLVKPFYILGIDAEVQNRVGKENYGLYLGLISLSFIFNMLIDLGINNFNNNNISKNTQLVSKHFSKLLSIKSGLALGYAFITLLVGWILDYRGFAFHLLIFLSFNQILVSFILFGRSNLAALHRFKADSIVSVLDRSLLVVFCSIILFGNVTDSEFKIEWFVYLQTAAYGITFLSLVFMLRPNIGRIKWHLDIPFSINIFKKSLPYASFMIIGSLYNRLDGIMLEKIGPLGSISAGEYAQGFRFFEAASMFAYLFAVLLLPIYSRMIKQKEDVRPIVETASRLLIGAGLAGAILFFFHSDFVLQWRYPDVSANSIHAFSALMIGFVGVGLFYVFGTLMTANENLRMLNQISIGGLIINLGLNFYLIPIHGAFGAAVATMATQLFAGIAQLSFVTKTFRFKANYSLIIQLIIYIILTIALTAIGISPWAENRTMGTSETSAAFF